MKGEVRCNGCRAWFDRSLPECPECATERPRFNRWLRTAGLNSHLYDAARASVADDAKVAAMRGA